MGKQIPRSKAKFLLDSIRGRGVHELMQKEILKILRRDGYSLEEIKYYVLNGKWLPESRQKVDIFPGIREESRNVSKGIIRKAAFTILMCLLVTFGALFLFSIMGAFDTDDKPEPALVETTKDGKRAL